MRLRTTFKKILAAAIASAVHGRAGGVGPKRAQTHRDPARLRHLQSAVAGPQGAQDPRGEPGGRQDRRPLGPEPGLQQGARIPQCRRHRSGLDGRRRGPAGRHQRQSHQVGLRLLAARMDGARHPRQHRHRQGRGPQGQAHRRHARHRSLHLPAAGPGPERPGRKGRHPRPAAASGRPSGAGARRCRRLGRSRSDDGAGRSRRRQAVSSRCRPQYLGRAQCPHGVRQGAAGTGGQGRCRLRAGAHLGQGEPGRTRQAAGNLRQDRCPRRRPADHAHRPQGRRHRSSRSCRRSKPPASPCKRPASSRPKST